MKTKLHSLRERRLLPDRLLQVGKCNYAGTMQRRDLRYVEL